jgi:hypothetical protein
VDKRMKGEVKTAQEVRKQKAIILKEGIPKVG